MTYLSVFYFVKNGPFISLQELCPTIHPLRNIKLDHHDHPETVSVTLYIKNISQESLKVDFEEKSISVTFRTRYKILSLILLLVIKFIFEIPPLYSDSGFLKQYPAFGEEDDLMQWQIETRETIVPEKCTFRLKPTNLELKLIKTVVSKWESLEATVGKYSEICLACEDRCSILIVYFLL